VPDPHCHSQTLEYEDQTDFGGSVTQLALTIAYHPHANRVGEVAEWTWDEPFVLSRTDGLFHSEDADGQALHDPYISRESVVFESSRTLGEVVIRTPDESYPLRVWEREAATTYRFDVADLRRGVILVVGKRAVLVLHQRFSALQDPPVYGLVGESTAIAELRRDITRVSRLHVPILIQGESGTGKELVARAVHDASGRRERPFIAVNMASVTPTTAASELFGHVKGAFTGADSSHPGFFGQADGGTLFLDEIGALSTKIQAMLLRALESGEIQPVGASKARRVDVRVLAATDADLKKAIADGSFSTPLLQRLSVYRIVVPPLRARRDDIGRLLVHFFERELRETGEAARLVDHSPKARNWVDPLTIAGLLGYGWPGNVRELRNVATQMVIYSQGRSKLYLPPVLSEVIGGEGSEETVDVAVSSTDAQTSSAKLSELSDDQLGALLRKYHWEFKEAAQVLGVSRSTLYRRVGRAEHIRAAVDVDEAELRASFERHQGRVHDMMMELEVSKRGIQMRLKKMGLKWS
jgi:two-component system, NtrC family, nitrogen regulation response regulator GlnG